MGTRMATVSSINAPSMKEPVAQIAFAICPPERPGRLTWRQVPMDTSYQRQVAIQILIGLIAIAVIGAALWFMVPEISEDARTRTVFCSVGLVTLPLVAGIQLMLFRRFNSPELIGGRTEADSLTIREIYLANTLEQTVLATGAILTCGFLVPVQLLSLPVIGAILFLVGRIGYYFGYSVDPMKRFVGFVIGHYSSLILLGIGLYFGILGA